MKPPKRSYEYEKVSTGDFVVGVIDTIQYEELHDFKFEGKAKQAPACRFKFVINGYAYPHYSGWMTFNYGKKSNLYTKYLVNLVENAFPDMDFDLDNLRGLKVKMLWANRGEYQHVETIRPDGQKVPFVDGVKIGDTMYTKPERPGDVIKFQSAEEQTEIQEKLPF
jgi:hypothetical protein